MPGLQSLIGNDHIKKILHGGLHFHAYLIEGEKGSGRHTLARIITQEALCESSGEKPCGICAGCKKFISGMHLDYIQIPFDIKAEPLREILNEVSVYPSEKGKKVYVIDNADKLSIRCQNILLKSLEEPPEFVVFILICCSKKSMLQTVLSRCLVLTMAPVAEKDAKIFLQNKYGQHEEISHAILLSGGYLGVAEHILKHEKTDLYNQCELFFQSFLARDPLAMCDCLNKKDRSEFSAYLDELRTYAKRVTRYTAVGIPDGMTACELSLASVGLYKISKVCEVLDNCAANSIYNVNIPLWSLFVAKELMNI